MGKHRLERRVVPVRVAGPAYGVEAVLDSINRGAIYRFYTKPWDDMTLRDNIRLAFRHYWMTHGPYDDRKTPREGDVTGQDAAPQAPLK